MDERIDKTDGWIDNQTYRMIKRWPDRQEREMDYLDKQKTDKYINRMKRVGGQ